MPNDIELPRDPVGAAIDKIAATLDHLKAVRGTDGEGAANLYFFEAVKHFEKLVAQEEA